MANPEKRPQAFQNCRWYVDTGITAEEIEDDGGEIYCEKLGPVCTAECLDCDLYEEW